MYSTSRSSGVPTLRSYPSPRHTAEEAKDAASRFQSELELLCDYYRATSPRPAIVGAVWVDRPSSMIPVGLEGSNDPKNPPPAYRSPFFGGTRDYVDDEDGFITVRHNKHRNRRVRRAQAAEMMDFD
jgi:hypothetical protein